MRTWPRLVMVIILMVPQSSCFESTEVCHPECGGLVCGPDPVCGLSCGDCGDGWACTAEGTCIPESCVDATELCGDAIDNDCDGETDEEFPDLGSACDNQGCPGTLVCSADRLSVVCDAPGPAADDAVCDGLDEDCDGTTDEDVIARLCPLQESFCAGTTEECLDGAWGGCDYGPGYTEGIDEGCDFVDNDCDGVTDEDSIPILEPESGAQATDGLDNNCNGLVDEPGGVMVPIPLYLDVWIDAYEIGVFSNRDCTGTQFGVTGDDFPAGFPADASQPTVELYACSREGILPSGHLSWYRARNACEAQGKRLCGESEWGTGCTGGLAQVFPYGTTFMEGWCNDPLGGTGSLEATGSHPLCTSAAHTFDMSGNLTEWTQRWDPDTPGHAYVGGGSYVCEFCEVDDACFDCLPDPDSWLTGKVATCRPGEHLRSFPRDVVKPYLGARCCLDAP